MKRTGIAIAALSAAGLVVTPVLGQEGGDTGKNRYGKTAEERAADHEAGRATGLSMNTKYCSYELSSGRWAATQVGALWSLRDCELFAGKVEFPGLGATKYQVICVSPDGWWDKSRFTWERNPTSRNLPERNECGWFVCGTGDC